MHPLSYQCGCDTNWLLKPLVLQSPFGMHFFPLLPLGTSYTLCSLSPPRARHDLACQLGSSATHSPAVKHELQVFRPTFGSNIVKSLVPKAVSHPFPPLPFPPPPHNFLWEVLASPIFETDAPTPPGQGFTITCSHTCLVCRSCENLAVHFFKNQNIFT